MKYTITFIADDIPFITHLKRYDKDVALQLAEANVKMMIGMSEIKWTYKLTAQKSKK